MLVVVRLLSIGYSGRTEAEFFELLRSYGVTHLADVRSVPYSKFRPEFGRAAVEVSAVAAGFKYIYLGDRLGGMPEEEEYYDEFGALDYRAVWDSDGFQVGLRQLIKGMENPGRVICLMCSEAKPEVCHRAKLIGAALGQQGISLSHIDESGELVDQEDVMRRIDGGQMELF
jgi:uncharacterized protein (DUF488 family)